MTNFENVTPQEAIEIFEAYLYKESENYMDRTNARYQINIEELEGGRKILRALLV